MLQNASRKYATMDNRTDKKIFINRRRGDDRREDMDLCKDLDVDLYHRKRRKKTERREERSLDEDYYAFLSNQDISDENNKGDQLFH
ncbi:MAG: hypothetical protein ACJAUP_001878 [Cellvibrionaceae bacterium]|jgi:hypothetical protein